MSVRSSALRLREFAESDPMRIRAVVLSVLSLSICGLGALAATPVYPPAVRGDHVDEYHGERIADPYRWMEDIDSPQTRAWVQSEAQLTSSYLAAIPGRDAIAKRLEKILKFER